jgi:hypothetical protein
VRARGRREDAREGERRSTGGIGPDAVLPRLLAGLVPSLHEVVVHVAGGGAAHLEVQVVDVAVAVVMQVPVSYRRMAGRDHRAVVEIDAADEGDLARLAGVDQPALLVMTEAGQVVPTGEEAGASRREPRTLVAGAREVRRLGHRLHQLRLAPEERAYVEAARGRPIEEVEQGTLRARKDEVALHERDRDPDARAGGCHGGGDAAEGRPAVHQRRDRVAGSDGVGAAGGGRDGRHRDCF